jgi:phosphonoacetaldehyde hydrolase
MSRYTGPLRAVIFDWAGTTVDYGCLAPVAVLLELFRSRGIEIGIEEARQSMGLLKKDHIRSLCSLPRIARAWSDRHGRVPAESDVEELFAQFTPLQIKCIARYSRLIPGVRETVQRLQARNLKIGTTSGYTGAMLDGLTEHARVQGYDPDATVCPDEVGGGRPAPWMCYENAIRLQVWPLEACVKIGDTVSDVEEGLNAGMWSIGVARTGNEVGLSEAEWNALSLPDQTARVQSARAKLTAAGAHYVIDAATDCEPVLAEIESKMARGERP